MLLSYKDLIVTNLIVTKKKEIYLKNRSIYYDKRYFKRLVGR